MSSSLVRSLTNNNTSTDDEETRINLLFPKCKVRGPPEPTSPKNNISVCSESETKCGLDANFPNLALVAERARTSDSNANREKLFSSKNTTGKKESEKEVVGGSLYIDNRQSGQPGLVRESVVVGSNLGGGVGQASFPGRAQKIGENVSRVNKRKEGYHYNISNQRPPTHNHNSCRPPCGIDLRRQLNLTKSSQFQKEKTETSEDVISSFNNVGSWTADRGGLDKKLDKATTTPPLLLSTTCPLTAGHKMDLDNSVVGDEDSGHFDNGTGSGSNGSTFSESNTPLSGGSGSGGSVAGTGRPLPAPLEIAGGREIFSQNKTRAGRRGRVVGSSTLDFEPHFLQAQQPSAGSSANKTGGGRSRKVIPPGMTVSPRYATKKSPLGRGETATQGSASSSVWELQVSKEENKQFGGPRIRSAYRHYGGSYKQKHKSGNSYGGQLRQRPHHHQSFPVYNYYSPPNPRSASHHNFTRDPISLRRLSSSPPFPVTHRVTTGTIKETMFGTEITSVEKSLIYDEMGRLVSCDQRLRTLDPTPTSTSAGKKSGVVYDVGYAAGGSEAGDIVFDDIEDWSESGGGKAGGESPGEMNSAGEMKFCSSANSSSGGVCWAGDNDEKGKLSYSQIMESSSSLCPSIQVEGNTSPSGYESDEISASALPHPNFLNENKRLIGNVPIAEYEGSPWHRPRRHGAHRHQQPPAASLPNDLDLVDLCSSGVHVSYHNTSAPSAFEGTTSGNKSPPDNQHSPTTNSNLAQNPPTTKLPTQQQSQSPNNGARLPGFPQRIHTNLHQQHSAQKSNAIESSATLAQAGNTSCGEVMDFSQIDTIENSNRFPSAHSKDEEFVKGTPSSQEPSLVVSSHGASPGSSGNTSTSLHAFQPNGTSPGIPGTTSSSTGAGKDLNEFSSLTLSREQCDYLYEFSETRKVLEEFFQSGEGNGSGRLVGGRGGISPCDFDELEYTLRRQNGNSYVGQRLAGDVAQGCGGASGVEESPKMPPRRGGREVVMSLGIPLEVEDGSDFGSSSRVITLHDVHDVSSRLSPTSKNSGPDDPGNRDVNDNDLDVETASTNTETDLGETEIGHQVRHHPRNFALSPETTDCDSNELESEMSLDYEVSVHSSSRVGTTMPVLEDGLSSANVSDNDEDVQDEENVGSGRGGHDSMSTGGVNPTLLLMKKQITEIEKEIQMRATISGGGENGTLTNSEVGTPENQGLSLTTVEGGSCAAGFEGPGTSKKAEFELSANANIKVHHEVPGSCDRRSNSSSLFDCNDPELEALDPMRPTPPPSPAPASAASHQSRSHNLSSSTTPLRPVTSSITQAISSPKVSSLVGTTSTTTTTTLSTANGIHLSTPGTAQSLPSTESKESISTHHHNHHHSSSSSSSTEPLKLISSIMTPPDSTKDPLQPHHRSTTKQYQLPKFDPSSFTSLLPKPSSLTMTTGPVCPPPQDDSPQSELHESSSEERLGPHGNSMSPVWVPRRSILRGERNHHGGGFGLREPFLRRRYEEIPDDDADTDQETDRLLGQHRTEDDYGFYNEKDWKKTKLRGILGSSAKPTPSSPPPMAQQSSSTSTKGLLASSSSFLKGSSSLVPGLLPPLQSAPAKNHSSNASSSSVQPNTCHQPPPKTIQQHHLSLNSPTAESNFPELPLSLPPSKPQKEKEGVKKKRNKEDLAKNPSVLIEGVLFRARYLGSTQLISEGQPTKATRMLQAEEAVSRIKAPEGETQPSTEVDLFISTEKIMVLNTDLKEIMMDHALRTISYIADIGDLVVLMARRRPVPTDTPEELSKIHRPPKMICHVFESDEAQYIAQSIGQAFQVAYMEFLKANGIEDHSFVREMDYQEVLNSQEIFGDELQMFAKKELQKDVVVPKAKGEILGVVIVESGWGSMLPTVVIANLAPAGAAARCGQLNIGDQIIAINGVSLVGLPLSTCQTYIKNSKTQTVVKLTVVPCPPVVEVKIKRPDTKYQLGFSVQNGVICSLLRGGIAERGGVRVGHRIIEINNQSVVAVPHEKIVNLLATSVGEINMKTMPTSMFRLLTGQETPLYI